MKSTKNKLLSSIATLLVCFAMLIGSTYAWFTDTASTGINKIQAGNLDIEVDYSINGTTWTSIEGTDSLFSDNLWEPGHTEYVYLKVKNVGTLSFKYKVLVSPVSENGGINVYNENFKLSDYLKFGITDPDVTSPSFTNRDDARTEVSSTAIGLTQTGLTKEEKITAGAADQYLALVVYMPEDVDNHANAKPGTTPPSIDLGINVVATQVENENDSFGSNYDEGAVNSSVYTIGPAYNYFPQIHTTVPVETSGNTVITATGKLNVTDEQKITLATVTVPREALSDDATAVTVSVIPAEATNPVALNTISAEIASGRETANFDIKVSGIKEGNTTDIPVSVYIGKGLSSVKAFHNGEEISGATYNSGTGMLSFVTTSFSDYTASYDAAVAAIGTSVYGSLAEAINAAPVSTGEPISITVIRDVKKAEGISVKGGKNLIINFAGHTYELDKPGVGSTNTETNGFQLLKDSTIIMKNGTITISEDNLTLATSGKNIKRIIQNYCNLTLDNMTIDGTNQYGGATYVMSFNNQPVNITGNTNIIAAEGNIAFDADGNWGSYNRCKVTINTTGTIVGNIELGQGYLDIKNANVKGGIVLCTSCGDGETNGQAERISITGGTFSTDPSQYVSTGYEAKPVNGKYVISEKWDVWDGTATSNNWDVGTDNKYHITSAADLKAFADSVNNGNSYAGKIIKLDVNVDLNNKEWTPIGQTGGYTAKTYFQGTFDGNGKTISNMLISDTAWEAGDNEGKNYATGFFGFIDEGNTEIKNVTFDNASVNGHHWVGVVAGYMTGTVTGVSVKNSTVSSTYKTSEADGDKAGGVVGCLNKGIVQHCNVISSVISAVRDCGSVVGFSTANGSVTKNLAKNCTVYYSTNENSQSGGEIAGKRASGVSDNTVTNVTVQKVTG